MLSSHRPITNVIFGSGLSNDAVNIASNPTMNGLSIDSSWISIYQDQGIFGDVLVGTVFLLLAADDAQSGTWAHASDWHFF